MPNATKPRVEPTDDWRQIALLAAWPEQRSYEGMRPVVLFGHPANERARETGTAERTLYRRLARFDAEGMASLFPPPKVEKHRRLPEPIRRHIRALKAEHPGFRPHEIAHICAVRCDRRPRPHTSKRLLAEDPPSPTAWRRFPPYHAIADPAEARLAIIRLHAEGWATKSIAAYLGGGKRTVERTLKRWIAEGVAGLDDKPHARKDGPRQVTLPVIRTVKELQENPRLGGFRVAAALRQQGSILRPRTCQRSMAKNRARYGAAPPEPPPREPKPHPFAAARPHEYWTLDIRHVDHYLGGGKIYGISVLENVSRAILASMLSRRQDLAAVLLVLYGAIRQWGIPEALVTDSGGVFLATHAQRVYAALGVRKVEIARRQPWQSLSEANFGTQMRMADYGFAQAASWGELLRVHEGWRADDNAQRHRAHQRREDGRVSPTGVLAGTAGRPIAQAELHRVCYTLRFTRVLDQRGYARFRHWQVYGERGLARRPVGVWRYGPQRLSEDREEPLAAFRVADEPGKRRLKTVAVHRLFDTPFRSPQPVLVPLDDDPWRQAWRVGDDAPRHPQRVPATQLPLFTAESLDALLA